MGFHLHREGSSEWEERQPKKPTVAVTSDRQAIRRRVNLNLTHPTIVTCMAVSGECALPEFIQSLELEDLSRGLAKEEIRFERHSLLKKVRKHPSKTNPSPTI
jgi:hypothetical protein